MAPPQKRSPARTLLKAVSGALLVVAVGVGSLLTEAHYEMAHIAPPLPTDAQIVAALSAAQGPISIRYINTSSQVGGSGPATLAHPAFLLEWRDGRTFLIDAGMTRQTAADFGAITQRVLSTGPVVVHGSVAEQLASLGTGIDGIAFTHLHEDHTDGTSALCAIAGPGFTIYQTPWQANLGNFGTALGRKPLTQTACAKQRTMQGESLFKVAGFGGLVAVPSAGHTPGSTVFFTRIDGHIWVLAGDVSNAIADIHNDRAKPWVYSTFITPENTERLGELRRWLNELDVRTTHTVMVSHDLVALTDGPMQAYKPSE